MRVNAETIRGLLDYCPDTGVFRWKVARGGKAKAGSVAGCVRADGYVVIRVGGVMYLAHRLAWLHAHGDWPPDQLDHIDRDPGNNRLANLRACNVAQNQQNKAAYRNGSEFGRGVTRHQHYDKFHARIMVNRKLFSLGYFDNPNEAAEAYQRARAELHKFAPEAA